MSELKATSSGEIRARDALLGYWWYEKSEADKVIAELRGDIKDLWDDKHYTDKMLDERNAEITELKKQVHDYAQGLYVMQARAEKEARHDKYKRCLALAKWSKNEEKRLEAIAPIFDTDKEYWEYNSDYWGKWCWRWLQLAEKFKEAK